MAPTPCCSIPHLAALITAAMLSLSISTSPLFAQQHQGSESQSAPQSPSRPLRIVTTFLPLQAHTLAITSGLAEVSQLLARDTGPHDFQLSPSDVRLIAEADLLIINGGGLESWLDELIRRAANPGLRIVDTSVGIAAVENPSQLPIKESSPKQSHHHPSNHDSSDHHPSGHSTDQPHPSQGHSHSHTHCSACGSDGQNPHFWLDPVLALHQARAILEALTKADPSNAETYTANARAYFAELERLDADFRGTLAPLPNKKLVSFHNAFPYLAARYGLEYVGYLEEFPEKDPTPRQLATLISAIRKYHIGILFAEQSYSAELLDRIARETGAAVSLLDTLEVGLGEPQSYLERMRANLETLRRAFTTQAARPPAS